jgi:hypothetical protein
MKDRQIHIKLPSQLHELVESAAKARGVTVTAVVTSLLSKWVTGLLPDTAYPDEQRAR